MRCQLQALSFGSKQAYGVEASVQHIKSLDNIGEANITPNGRLFMSKVFVLDTKKRPLLPCHPAKARKLLKQGKAAVFRYYPFTIILKREVLEPALQPLRLKVDPGSKIAGLAVVNDATGEVVFAAEIQHRGDEIKDSLDTRRTLRRARRNRKTRYRAPRFLNRRRREGWLPPSLESRVANVVTWVSRIRRYCPIQSISMELAKFDLQKLENPEIQGVEYQQGTLFGYEVKEYLLEKFGHKCAYCHGKSGDPMLEVEHVIPKNPKHGPKGTDRISNLVIACETCNKAKDNDQPEEWYARLQASEDPLDQERARNFPAVMQQLKQPLKDATAVNATRWVLYRQLKDMGLPMEAGSGGRTKYNRSKLGLPKAHWIDAACVGVSTPEQISINKVVVLEIRAVGHGKRQRCGTDKYGFPIRYAPKVKTFMGYKTGDLVKAVIPKGKYAGVHIGRIAIRHKPSFKLNGFDVHPKYLRLLQGADGYEYVLKRKSDVSSPGINAGAPGVA